MSCKEPIKTSVLKEARFYMFTLYAISLSSFLGLMTFTLVLMSKCIAWCRKSRSGNEAKQRAANGMVVSDFDEIKSKDTPVKTEA